MRRVIFFWVLVFALWFCAEAAYCETWHTYIYTGDVKALCATGTTIWIGTTGGVVALEKSTGSLRRWSKADGLASNTVIDLKVAPDGSIWALGPYGELSCFSGERWVSFVPVLDGERRWPQSWELVIDAGGAKWFATTPGIYRFDESGYALYQPLHPGARSDPFWACGIDTRDTKWFAKGLLIPEGVVNTTDGSSWEHYTTSNSGIVDDVIGAIGADSLGGVWFSAFFGGTKGVSRFDGTSWASWTNVVSSPVQIAEGMGRVWFCEDYKVKGFDGTTWTAFDRSNSPFGLGDIKLTSICFDGDDDAWVGSTRFSAGPETPVLYHFDGSLWTGIDIEREGIADNTVEQIAVPPVGSMLSLKVWLRYNAWTGATLFDFSTGSWTTYNKGNSGLPMDYIRSLAIDYDGLVWFGTDEGVASFDGQMWRVFRQGTSGLFRNTVTVVGVGRDNVKWFCHSFVTDISGKAIFALSSFDGQNWAHYEVQTPSTISSITCFAQDASGANWLGTQGDGVYRLAMPAFQHFTKENSPLPWNDVYMIFFDRDGALWMSGGSGDDEPVRLLRYSSGQIEFLTPDTTGLPAKSVLSMDQDSMGRLYFGTDGGGLSIYDGVGWLTLDGNNSPLPGSMIRSVALDWLGNTWLATWGGLGVLMAGPLDNQYPARPSVSTGWRTALPGELLSFDAQSSDPNGNALQYRFDLGDGTRIDWQDSAQAAKGFDAPGRYLVKSEARDNRGGVSAWSVPFELAVKEQYAPSPFIWTNSQEYRRGQVLIAEAYVENRGEAQEVEALVWATLPDGSRLYYPSWGADATPIPLMLASGAKLGPVTLLSLEISDIFPKGDYVFTFELRDNASGEVLDSSASALRLM